MPDENKPDDVNEPDPVDVEIQVMQDCLTALNTLEHHEAKVRVIQWLEQRVSSAYLRRTTHSNAR